MGLGLFCLFGLVLVISATEVSEKPSEVEEKCSAGKCQNGGICIDEEENNKKSIHCECAFGFGGQFCETHQLMALNFFHYDPEYMHDHPKDVWGRRYETEAWRPIVAGSTATVADVIERFYNTILRADAFRQNSPLGFVSKRK